MARRRATVETSCSRVHLESFIEGTQPEALCGRLHHFRSSLPYFLQPLPLTADLRVSLENQDLDAFLRKESAFVRLLPMSSSLSVTYKDRATTIGLERRDPMDRLFGSDARPALPPEGRLLVLGPDEIPINLPPPPEDSLPLDELRGLDGRVPTPRVIRLQAGSR